MSVSTGLTGGGGGGATMDGAATAVGGAASEMIASWKLEGGATMGDTDKDTDEEIGVTIDLVAMVVESLMAVGELTWSKAPTVGD